MKHIAGDPWTYGNIEYEIKEIMAKLKINRMPTFAEMNEVTNSGSLTNAINKTGGLMVWKINLDLVEKKKKTISTKITEEVRCEIQKLRADGKKLKEIANRFGISIDTVYRQLRIKMEEVGAIGKQRLEKTTPEEARREEVNKICKEIERRKMEEESWWKEQIKEEKKLLKERFGFVAK